MKRNSKAWAKKWLKQTARAFNDVRWTASGGEQGPARAISVDPSLLRYSEIPKSALSDLVV